MEHYIYSILKKGRCIYIGSGKNDRVEKSKIIQNGDDYLILVSGLTRDKSLELERSFLKEVKPKNNKYVGGKELKSGDKWDYWREWIRK